MKISIFTSVYNDEEILPHFFEGVLSQKFPPEIEVEFLICDDASTDGSLAIIEEIERKESTITICVVRNKKNLGQSASLNNLYARATGTVFVIIDDDAVPRGTNWLMKLTIPIIRGNASVVQGNFWTQFAPKTFFVAEHEKWRRSASLRRFRNTDGTYQTVNTRNLAISAGALHEVNTMYGYILNPATVCGADTELGFTLNKLGYKVVLEENAIVEHDDPATLVGIMKQKMWHAYNDGRIGISYPRGFYYGIYYPYVNDNVSLIFSVPIAGVFSIANIAGLIVRALKL